MDLTSKLRRVSLAVGLSLAFLPGFFVLPAQSSERIVSAPGPNRTLPNVEPPKGSLALPAEPSIEDFFRIHAFEEPLVPVGGEPSSADNAALAAALVDYARRTGPDDFSSLTSFLAEHPNSPWRAALLTDLGLEYYNSARYSLAIEAWTKAWSLAKDARESRAKALADRAAGELAYMYGRLGRMTELEPLLNSVQSRVFQGPATERISSARAGLHEMKVRPEISFRCGPLALHRIKLSVDPEHAGPATRAVYKSASTQQGFSLSQVADLSKAVGLNYQAVFRSAGATFVVPAVIHWKVGHYPAGRRTIFTARPDLPQRCVGDGSDLGK